jgi:hypothetical protein
MSPLLAVTLVALAMTKPQLAAMPLAAKHLPVETVQILDLLLVSELEASGTYSVVRPADIDAMLGLERMKDAAGCDDVSCASDIANALGVGLLLTGTAGKLGDELVLQLTLIDVAAQRVVRRAQVTAKADERAYRDAVKRAVAEIQGLASKPVPKTSDTPPSNLTLRFDTTELSRSFDVRVVTSDGIEHTCEKPVALSDGCTLNALALGNAQLFARSAPLSPLQRSLTAKNEKETIVYSLKESPGLGSIIAWTYGGIALAAGIALTSVGLALDKNGLVYGGVPAALVGGGLIGLGFYFDGTVMATTRHLREDGSTRLFDFFN